MPLDSQIALGGAARAPAQQDPLAGIASLMQLVQMVQQNKRAEMESAQKQKLFPIQLQQAQIAAKKAEFDAEKAKEQQQFYSPENRAQYTTPGLSAIAQPTEEAGGGPGRAAVAPKLDFDAYLQAAAAKGIVDPEKYADHMAKREQARASLAATIESRNQASRDRQYSIESANERAGQMSVDRQLAMDARAQQAAQQRSRDLKAGERFAADGTIEVIPGSSEWNRRANLHSKDYSQLKSMDTKTDNAIRKLDSILSPQNTDSFNKNFGGYNALASQYLPGETQNLRASLESLKSDLKSAGLDMMRAGGSIGQMTVQEWPIVQNAIESITPLLSEKEARDRLMGVKSHLERIRGNAKDVYEREWAQQPQFYNGKTQVSAPAQPAGQPATTGKPLKNAKGWSLMRDPVSGVQAYVGPNGVFEVAQ